jgi:hypothetical protein
VLATRARLVFWVPAISRESFELAYREVGVRLRIPGIAADNADVKRLVQQALSSKGADDWLMIVDNADDYEVLLSKADSGSKPTRLSDYLPRSDRGAILFTTRSRKVAAALTPSSVLRLDGMSKGEARQLLSQHTTEQALCSDETAVDELLEALTCLPLTIVQAAAFMSTNNVSVSDYLALFRDTEAQATERRDQDDLLHPSQTSIAGASGGSLLTPSVATHGDSLTSGFSAVSKSGAIPTIEAYHNGSCLPSPPQQQSSFYYQQPPPSRYAPGPAPAPVSSNVANPNGGLALVGVHPGMMPGFNSGHAAQMPHFMSRYNPHGQPLSGHRPFKCDQCPQSFGRNHDLKRHKRIHLAVKPFPCHYCDKSFSRKDALKVMHVRSNILQLLIEHSVTFW